jgi:hypothetical protein
MEGAGGTIAAFSEGADRDLLEETLGAGGMMASNVSLVRI